MPILVGFTGLATSGKDTCADLVAERSGRERVARYAFVRPLKHALRELFDLSDEQLWGNEKEVVDARWGKSPRELMQWFGTEVVRDQFDEAFFLKRMREDLKKHAADPEAVVMVTDVRFDNEAELIREMGGVVVRVHRPSAAMRRLGHSSESGVSDRLCDFVVVNDGTLDDLWTKLAETLRL